jgi:hypothetical protein
MSQTMGNVEAIKTYFGKDSRPVENKEILEARRGMSKEEWEQIAADCCKALGVEYKPAN